MNVLGGRILVESAGPSLVFFFFLDRRRPEVKLESPSGSLKSSFDRVNCANFALLEVSSSLRCTFVPAVAKATVQSRNRTSSKSK